MTVKKSLMFGSNSTLNDESNVTAKNLLMRQHHTKVARKKKGSDGSDYEPSDDECSEGIFESYWNYSIRLSFIVYQYPSSCPK